MRNLQSGKKESRRRHPPDCKTRKKNGAEAGGAGENREKIKREKGGRRDGRKGRKKNRTAGPVDYDHYFFSLKERTRFCAQGLGIGMFIVWLCYRSFYASPLAAAIAAFYLFLKRKERIRARKMNLNWHFRDFLSALHTSLAAGYSLENGIRAAAGDIVRLYGREDTLSVELMAMLRQMDYQRPCEELFRDLGERSGLEDLISFAEVIAIAKRSGGNLNRILENTRRNLSEKIDTAKEIQAGQASREYEQKLMSLMPAAIILYVQLIFPDLLDPLYHSLPGAAVMTACLVLYGAALFLGRYLLRKDSAALFS